MHHQETKAAVLRAVNTFEAVARKVNFAKHAPDHFDFIRYSGSNSTAFVLANRPVTHGVWVGPSSLLECSFLVGFDRTRLQGIPWLWQQLYTNDQYATAQEGRKFWPLP